MIVYYIADDEHPETHDGVKFYLDHASAQDAALMERKMVFSFEVNDKCDTNSFGMDTLMLFRKDLDTGELKFLCSGRWTEIHEIMNIPFYLDFEKRSKVYVSMSLKWFNEHYAIIERAQDVPVVVQVEPERRKRKQVEKSVPVKEEPILSQNEVVSEDPETTDQDIINMLFGG